MSNHRRCPECGAFNTEVVNTEVMENYIERVRICHECPTQWIVEFVSPIVREVRAETGE